MRVCEANACVGEARPPPEETTDETTEETVDGTADMYYCFYEQLEYYCAEDDAADCWDDKYYCDDFDYCWYHGEYEYGWLEDDSSSDTEYGPEWYDYDILDEETGTHWYCYNMDYVYEGEYLDTYCVFHLEDDVQDLWCDQLMYCWE